MMIEKRFLQNNPQVLVAALTTFSLFSGCQKLSSIPTSQDNFIIVPPANLIVVGAHDAAILIYWNPVSAVGFSYYNIYFGTKPANLRLTTETTDNAFFIDSLNYDSTYFFQVTAVYSNDSESTPSNLVSAKPVNVYPPNTPIGLTVQGHNDNSGKYMTIFWNANTDDDLGGYEVYRDTSASFQPDTINFSNLISISQTNVFRDSSNLTVSRNYYYKIIAFDFDHWRSQPSQSANDRILDRPSLISPADNSTFSAQDNLSFTFGAVDGSSGYIFYITASPNGGDVFTTNLAPGQDSVFISGSSLNPNELYFWHVAATTNDPNIPNSTSLVYSFMLTQ
jgi:hypothetical protein